MNTSSTKSNLTFRAVLARELSAWAPYFRWTFLIGGVVMTFSAAVLDDPLHAFGAIVYLVGYWLVTDELRKKGRL